MVFVIRTVGDPLLVAEAVPTTLELARRSTLDNVRGVAMATVGFLASRPHLPVLDRV